MDVGFVVVIVNKILPRHLALNGRASKCYGEEVTCVDLVVLKPQ